MSIVFGAGESEIRRDQEHIWEVTHALGKQELRGSYY